MVASCAASASMLVVVLATVTPVVVAGLLAWAAALFNAVVATAAFAIDVWIGMALAEAVVSVVSDIVIASTCIM